MDTFPIRISPERLPLTRDVVYEVLYDAIVGGVLKPGQQIRERQIAEALGVSTTPVKTALTRLQVEGLVYIKPRHGTFVADVFSALYEMMIVRASLEGLAARFAAEKAVESDKEKIARQLDLLEKWTLVGDRDEALKAGTNFHRLVFKISRNEYLNNIVRGARSVGPTFWSHSGDGEFDFDQGLVEHRRIGNAIIRSDPDAAEQAMKEHILRATTFKLKQDGIEGGA